MVTETASNIIGVLSHRIEFIDCLLDGPKTKPEFVEELDISRSTANRAVRELESVGFLEYQDTGYRLILCGRLAAQEYQAFKDSGFAEEVLFPADLLNAETCGLDSDAETHAECTKQPSF